MSTRNAFDSAIFNHHYGPVNPPGLGNNLVITPPVNTRAELLLLNFEFVSDINVANRYIRLYLKRDFYTAYIAGGSPTIVASTTRNIIIAPHISCLDTDHGDTLNIPLAPLPVVLEGDSIRSSIQNIQVGDKIWDVFVIWKVWTYEQ